MPDRSLTWCKRSHLHCLSNCFSFNDFSEILNTLRGTDNNAWIVKWWLFRLRERRARGASRFGIKFIRNLDVDRFAGEEAFVQVI